MTPSTIDAGALARGGTGPLELLDDREAGAMPVLLVDGSSASWGLLTDEGVPAMDAVEAWFRRTPRVLVGRVRGRCHGPAASLAASLDLVFGVEPGLDADGGVRFVRRASEEVIAGELARVVAAVAVRASSSVVAATLLRGQLERPLPDALVSEAMAYSLLQAGGDFRDWLGSRGRA